MKNGKKMLAGFLSLTMILSLTACGGGVGSVLTGESTDNNITGSVNTGIEGFEVQGGYGVEAGSPSNSFLDGFGISSDTTAGGSSQYNDGANAGYNTYNEQQKEEIVEPDYIEEEPDWNTEGYNVIKENSFKQVSVSPLSTFAADVDTASYSNVRRMINNGYFDSGAVRIEEMVNYFNYNYDYPDIDDDTPFGMTAEINQCPWNDEHLLMQIGLATPEIDMDDVPAQNIVLLLDISGSMYDYNKLPYVQQSMSMFLDNLKEGRDHVQVVTYAAGTDVLVSNKDEMSFEEIKDAINSLEANGGTAGRDALEVAYNLAKDSFIEDGNNMILLASDGDFNIGMSSQSEMLKFIKNQAKKDIFISVLGFGMGNYKDDMMETIANNGNGKYYYIDSLDEAEKVLVTQAGGTLFTVAKDVKYQVEFNPDVIEEYRLIGYENRVMAAEDFADDTKDGGEIGCGTVTTALYELVPTGKSTNSKINLKYQESQSTGSEDFCTVSIRYKQPKGFKSILVEFPVTSADVSDELSDNMKLAAGVAEFGLMLIDSEYKGTCNYSDAKKLINSIDDDMGNDIDELLGLMKDANKMNILNED